MQPCKDPKTGNWPSCVKRVDSNGNMILSEKELNDPNRDYFIREDAVIDVVDGMTFDLDMQGTCVWCVAIFPARSRSAIVKTSFWRIALLHLTRILLLKNLLSKPPSSAPLLPSKIPSRVRLSANYEIL